LPTKKPLTRGALESLARSHSGQAIRSLSAISRAGRSESARVAASVALLDRGFGKSLGLPEGVTSVIVQLVDLGPGVREAGDRLVSGPGVIEGKTELEPVDPLEAAESGIEQTVNKGETP
jgi:hypothetical protein